MRLSLQEYADRTVDPKYRRPLQTLTEAMNFHSWHGEHPICCGAAIKIDNFLGDTYLAQCQTCRKFIADTAAPQFGNGHVLFLDQDKVNVDTDRRWIAGVQATGASS